MAAPGRFMVQGGDRQRLFDSAPKELRVYRVNNSGPGVIGVSYTNVEGEPSRSLSIAAGLSADLCTSDLSVTLISGTMSQGTYELA